MKYGIIVENLCDWTLCRIEDTSYNFFIEIETVITTAHSSFVVGEKRIVLGTSLKSISKKEYAKNI